MFQIKHYHVIATTGSRVEGMLKVLLARLVIVHEKTN